MKQAFLDITTIYLSISVICSCHWMILPPVFTIASIHSTVRPLFYDIDLLLRVNLGLYRLTTSLILASARGPTSAPLNVCSTHIIAPHDSQVYIVAMHEDTVRRQRALTITEEEDEFGEFSSSNVGENLLSLVQPEMKTLSSWWLSALQDHARLCLPEGQGSNTVLAK